MTSSSPAHPHFLGLSEAARTVSPTAPTILFAEDNDDLRLIVTYTCEALGYHVIPCSDAQIAATAYRLQPKIDLLLTDFQMPGPSGVELARELTNLNPLLPVLIYTGTPLSFELMHEIHDTGSTSVSPVIRPSWNPH